MGTSDDKQVAHIRFFCKVNENTVGRLKDAIEKELTNGIKRFVLSMRTTGGDWRPAFEAYEYLKKIRAEVITHNCHYVGSAAIIIFCAGKQRTCVSKGKFKFHPVLIREEGRPLVDKDVVDKYNRCIARIIADSCDQDQDTTLLVIKNKVQLSSEEALDFRLVHKIRDTLSTKGGKEVQIGDEF